MNWSFSSLYLSIHIFAFFFIASVSIFFFIFFFNLVHFQLINFDSTFRQGYGGDVKRISPTSYSGRMELVRTGFSCQRLIHGVDQKVSI